MDPLKQLLVLSAIVGCIDGFHLVIAPPGRCWKTRASVKIYMTKMSCQRIKESSSNDDDWYDCDLDMCDLTSSSDPISIRKSWGIDLNQEKPAGDRLVVKIFMVRRDCDRIRGTYDGNPTADERTGCYLYMKSMAGSSRKNIDSFIFAGDKQCENKVTNAMIKMTNRECVQNGGRYDGSPGGKDWTDCILDMCISPVIKCKPSDRWVPLMTCAAAGTGVTTCNFEMTVGIEKSSSSSSTFGGSVSPTVSYEAGVQLEGLFSASVGVSVSTGFSWSNTKGTSQLWSKAVKRSFQTQVNPGKTVSINQVVGMCGDYRVDTFEYSLTEVTKKK